MCGIGGVYLKDDSSLPAHKLEDLCDALLVNIQHRGEDATGFAAFSLNDWSNPTVDKAPEPALQFIQNRKPLPENTRLVLLHTRLATQGHQSFNGNNHPVRVKDWLVTHNGIIWNDADVFDDLKMKAHAIVDTEAISASLAYYGMPKVEKALEKCEGSLAIGAASTKHPMECIVARGADSPLYVHETETMIVWSSTLDAIIDSWRFAIGTPPRRHKPEYVSEGTLFRINGTVQRSRFRPERYTHYYTKGVACELYDLDETRKWWEKEYPKDRELTTGDSVKIQCSYCQILTPINDIETSFDGRMICEDCASFWGKGKLIAVDEKCEYCGTTKNVLHDPSGEDICETCLTEFLS